MRAEGDLAHARSGRTLAPAHAWATAFHSQQAVEKTLKAYLVLLQRPFPYTHEIDVLIRLCGAPIHGHAGVAPAIELTAYAVAARYPGIAPTPEAAELALFIAEQAVLAIRAEIVVEGGPALP
jgi:HEPN domain-containing protein